MEEVSNSMGQVQTSPSCESVELNASITSSVPDIGTEVVLEESKETSTNDSIICLDDDEDDYVLPDLPTIFPPKDEASKDDKVSNDDDFSIVYEKVNPSPEIQIVLTDCTEKHLRKTLSNSRGRKKLKLTPNFVGSSDQNVNIELRNEVERQESPLDDSVSIIEEVCTTSHLIKTKNSLKQALIDSTEKKKRKVECAICFDGPDDISRTGRNLVSTVCGHIFCNECIKGAVQVNKKCPQCRKKLTAKQYHPIYL